MASFRMALSYDLDRARNGGDSLSDLDFRLRFTPAPFLDFRLDGGVNPGPWQFTQILAGVAINGFAAAATALALNLAPQGIRVNCVAPGFIDTDMTRALSEQHRTALLEKIPLNRLGQMEEVAAAVAFLASPAASYITGETLHVNGGMFMS